MRTINKVELANISGGDWQNFVDGACLAYASAIFLDWIPPKLIGDVACIGWGVYRGISAAS